MSYTNQTQHYGLPQYVATDIPAYLTDYNTAMATIDQGMNSAKTQAESAATAAGQAANDINALQSTVNTQATQISAAAQAASAAQTTANGADGKADTNAQAITGLDDRVTALEEGGGGSSFVTEDYEMNSADLRIPLKSGYTAIAVSVKEQRVATLAAYHFPMLSRNANENRVTMKLITSSNGIDAPSSVNCTVTVLYIPTT